MSAKKRKAPKKRQRVPQPDAPPVSSATAREDGPTRTAPVPPASCRLPADGLSAGHTYLILGTILLVGFVLRAVYLAEIVREPDFNFPTMDPQYNDYWARGMATGDWTPPEGYPDPQIRTTPHGRPCGYPYFLSFVYRIFGLGYLAPRLVQMALGLVNGMLMFYLARAVFGRVVALIATAFTVTYWVFIHFEGELTYPVVAVFVLLVFMHALRWWALKPSVVRALLAGLLFGLFGLFRPNAFLFGPVIVGWFFWVLGGRRNLRPFLLQSAVLTAATVLAIAPALIRNVVVAGDFVFLSSYGGVNLWAGNNADSDCVTPKIPDLEEIAGFEDWTCFHYPLIVRRLGRKLGRPDLRFSEANQYFYRKGRAFILSHPLKTLQLTGKRALIFWGPTETTNDKVLHWVKKRSPTLRWLPGFPKVLAVFVLGSILFFLDLRRRPWRDSESERQPVAVALILFLFIFVYFASVMPYFVAGRYRIPVIPFLLLFGAYGVYRIGRFIAEGDRRRAGLWVAAGALVCGVGSVQFYSYRPDLAIWHQHRAKGFEEKGELDKAIAEVRKELEISPHYADGHNFLGKLLEQQGKAGEAIAVYRKVLELEAGNHVAMNNLGYMLGEQGRTADAVQWLERALEANPQFGLAHNNLGNLLGRQGQHGQAVAHYETALELDPQDRFADYNLGNAYAAVGRTDRAVPHYERAMALDARNPDIPNNLGLALAGQGKSAEAIRSYEQALDIDPDYANAYNNLGYELAKLGRFEEAAERYEEALRLNPSFALAHNNLGKLLADRDRPDEAMAHYRRALEIDPEDPHAAFNIAELLASQAKWAEAAGHYLRAMENAPGNPDIPNNLANALVKQERVEEAIPYYKRALAIDPDYGPARENLRLIREAQRRGSGAGP